MRDESAPGPLTQASAPKAPARLKGEDARFIRLRPPRKGKLKGMASEVLCGRCGALLTDPNAPCPRCGAPASIGYGPSVARAPKSPTLAAFLALFPGLGHFYLGHNMKGLAYLVGIGGLQFFGFDLDLSVIGAAVGVPMELGGGALWVFSIFDAYRTAKQMERFRQ